MKKSKNILSLLCLCPLLLCACQPSAYYKITAISSSTALGSVSGYSSKKIAEGQTITLTARENNPQTNPLIAWVKDNEYLVKIAGEVENDGVVSTDTNLSIISSEETEGKYTAVFNEDRNSMMYAYVTNTVLVIDGAQQTSEAYTYKLYYAIMSAGSDLYLPYEDKVGEGINTNILYFGGLGQNYEYKFKVEVSIKASEGESNETSMDTKVNETIISKVDFKEKKSLDFELSFNEEKTGTFTLTLDKFSTEIRQLINTQE